MSDQCDSRTRYLPPGSLRKERRAGVIAGVVLTLLVGVAALLMLAIVLLAVLRGGNGWGSGCCQPACCQTSCCAQPACRVPQADRYLPAPDVDMRGRPLPHADPRDESIPTYRQPDNRAGYVRPCGCQTLPWWQPHTPDDTVHSVPEPGTLALVTVGALVMWRMT
jgi:hypothetical protein